MISTAIPVMQAAAVYGPGYGPRTERAYKYLQDYIENNGEYLFPGSTNYKGISVDLQDGVAFNLRLDKMNHNDLGFSFEFTENTIDPWLDKAGMVTLLLENGYWQYEENWVGNGQWVSGTYYMSTRSKTENSFIGINYVVLPRTFSETTGLTRYHYYSGPADEETETAKAAAHGVNDILTMLDPILKQGGYTLADLGFSAYQGHTSHSYWKDPIEVLPTCTESGYYSQTCYVCGIENRKNYAALGHAWAITEILSEAGEG